MRTFLPVVWTAAATCVLAAPHPSPSTLPRISRARRSPQDSWDARQSHSVLPPPGLSLSSPHKEPTGPRGTSSTHPTHRTTRQLVSTPRRSSGKQEELQGSDDSSTSPALSTFFRALRSPLPENPEKDPEGPVKDTDAKGDHQESLAGLRGVEYHPDGAGQ
ncbi:hypothetical protein O3P69_005993 [Scylla paramamosain]|uniref:Uncharacterized protein n=1 Tax=Scylla paramamosain TaxID=85552 RepID=A0AAW0U7U5_SCYPA